MEATPIDLAACEAEPIQRLGLVQPHGALLVVRSTAPYRLLHWSDNVRDLVGFAGDALQVGTPLAVLLGHLSALGVAAESFIETVLQTPETVHTIRKARFGPPGREQAGCVTAHRNGDALFLEFERPAEAAADLAAQEALSKDNGCPPWEAGCRDSGEGNLFALTSRIARAFRKVFDYHRVMVYQFHPDWSGEVIAETRQAGMTAYLGHRFPATDIPPQARDLYRRVVVRVITDVGGVPALLVPPAHFAADHPVDLSFCRLRSVSPYHIEYLRNMGVGATLVASLIIDGALWGLIACHHQTPHPVTPTQHELADRLATLAAGSIQATLDQAHRVRKERAQAYLTKLTENRPYLRTARPVAPAFHDLAKRLTRMIGGTIRDVLERDGTVRDARADAEQALMLSFRPFVLDFLRRLLFGAPKLAEAVRCSSVGVYANGTFIVSGPAPSAAWLDRLICALVRRAESETVALESVGTWDAGFAEHPSQVSGVLISIISRQPIIAIFCLRPELIREIHWGGDPTRPVELDPLTHRLSPRKSFEAWRETVNGHARPWTSVEKELVAALASHLYRDVGLSSPELADIVARQLEILALEFRQSEPEQLHPVLFDAALEGMALTVTVDERNSVRGVTFSSRFGNAFTIEKPPEPGLPLPDLLGQIGLPPDLIDPVFEGAREVVAMSPTQGSVTLIANCRPVFLARTPLGEQRWHVFVFQDVTRFRTVFEALSERAELADRERGAFLRLIRDELLTPLNSIIKVSESLYEADHYPAVAHSTMAGQVELMQRLWRRLAVRAEDLVELTKLRSGWHILNEAEFELRLAVRQACDGVESLFNGALTALTRDIDGPLLFFRGEASAIRQAVRAVLSSAFEFAQANVRIHCGIGELPDGVVVVTIRYEGLALATPDLDGLAETRVPTAPAARDGNGAIGLGLPLAKALIELHGGTMTLSNGTDAGTAVTIGLPPWRRATPVPEPAAIGARRAPVH